MMTDRRRMSLVARTQEGNTSVYAGCWRVPRVDPRYLDRPRFVGTARQVADQVEEWFSTGACDGFVTDATHFPSAIEDFARPSGRI
jgi:alkanesulfonate monooxygenase SsuD/methylene tetrahydromethanopterin reductase-like flavin-dependent oxidoreductase (luciferase family)